MNARERLQNMIRVERGDMTVWSEPEIRDAFAAYDAELLAEHGATPAGQDRLQRALLFALAWHGTPAELHTGINKILTEDGETADFFQPGRTYTENAPYRAPEDRPNFQCVAVAVHPTKGNRRALGFEQSGAGAPWASASMRDEEWWDGWVEVAEGEATDA